MLIFLLFPIKETPSYYSLIHVPTRGTTEFMTKYCNIKQFQSTFPQGERHTWKALRWIISECFNPRSHKGNDGIHGALCGIH